MKQTTPPPQGCAVPRPVAHLATLSPCRLVIFALARRMAIGLGVFGFYLLLAVVALSPLASHELPDSPAQDLANHVSGIIEARNALAEGQFPIRVAPKQNRGERYPIFQFYGNLPYTAGGLLYLKTNSNPYKIWKYLVTFFLALGGFYTYRSTLLLFRQTLPAVVAGALFLTAPYMLTDIHGRFAYPEVVSFNLLPVVFFYLWRSFTSSRIGPLLASAVAWSCLALSHNVTYFYGSVFFCLYLLTWLAFRRDFFLGMLRVGLGYLGGFLLTAWYIIPQLHLVRYLVINDLGSVADRAWLTRLGVLLAPTVVPPVPVPTVLIGLPMHFGLQAGWPILACVALAACSLRRSGGKLRNERRTVLRLIVFFTVVFFMVWTPIDFWKWLPKPFAFVQFPYRLLMFVALWGALLVGPALGHVFKRNMRFEHLVLCLLIVGAFTAPYLRPHKSTTDVSVEQEIVHPEMGRGGATCAYLMSPAVLVETTAPDNDANWADYEYNVLPGDHHVYYPGEGELPAPRAGDTLRIDGEVPPGHPAPINVTITLDGATVCATSLPQGPFHLAVPIARSFSNDRVHLTIRSDRYLSPRTRRPVPPGRDAIAFFISSLKLERWPSPLDRRPVLRAEQFRQPADANQPATYHFDTTSSGLVQLPVLFYPGVLQVHADGQRLPYGNMGRFVAVELPAGSHVVSVRFMGIRWANSLSLVTCIVVLAIPVVVAVLRLWRSFGARGRQRRQLLAERSDAKAA